MRSVFLAAMVWAIGATATVAASVRLDVTGSAGGFVSGNGGFVTDADGNSVSLGGWSFDLRELVALGVWPQFYFDVVEFTAATTGSAILSGARITDCRGLLLPICGEYRQTFGDRVDYDVATQTFSVRSRSEIGDLSAGTGGLLWMDSAPRSFGIGNTRYVGEFGNAADAFASFSTATLTPIPLPGTAPLVLAGMAALVVLRRRHG